MYVNIVVQCRDDFPLLSPSQTPHEVEPVQIWSPKELVKVYSQLGCNEKLKLEGRPSRPIGALGTSKVRKSRCLIQEIKMCRDDFLNVLKIQIFPHKDSNLANSPGVPHRRENGALVFEVSDFCLMCLNGFESYKILNSIFYILHCKASHNCIFSWKGEQRSSS